MLTVFRFPWITLLSGRQFNGELDVLLPILALVSDRNGSIHNFVFVSFFVLNYSVFAMILCHFYL